MIYSALPRSVPLHPLYSQGHLSGSLLKAPIGTSCRTQFKIKSYYIKVTGDVIWIASRLPVIKTASENLNIDKKLTPNDLDWLYGGFFSIFVALYLDFLC